MVNWKPNECVIKSLVINGYLQIITLTTCSFSTQSFNQKIGICPTITLLGFQSSDFYLGINKTLCKL